MDTKNLIYSNQASVNVAWSDIQLSFSQKAFDASGTLIHSDESITIAMSPQHAKMFSQLLSESITHYENVFGNININPVETGEQDG